jgi:type VI protein secretion system component VasK
MNSADIMLADVAPLPQWANFLAMALAILLVAIGSLIWFLMFRKKRKRKRKHHSHEKRQLNPTLAECGGLPPKRDDLNSPPAGL